MVLMFNFVVFAGIGLLGGMTCATVMNLGRVEPASTRGDLWRLLFWGVIGAAIGALVALAYRFPVFLTPV